MRLLPASLRAAMALAIVVSLPAHLELTPRTIEARLLARHTGLGFVDLALVPMNLGLDARAILFQVCDATFRVREEPLGLIVLRVGVVIDTAHVVTGKLLCRSVAVKRELKGRAGDEQRGRWVGLVGELQGDSRIDHGHDAARGQEVGSPGMLGFLGGQEGDADGDVSSQRAERLDEPFAGIGESRYEVDAGGELDEGIAGQSLLKERLRAVEALLGEGLPHLRGDGVSGGVVRSHFEHQAGELQGACRLAMHGSGGGMPDGRLHDGIQGLLMGQVVGSKGHAFPGEPQGLDEVLTTCHHVGLVNSQNGLLLSGLAEHDRGMRVPGVEACGLFVRLRGAVPHLGASELIAPLHGLGEGAAASATEERHQQKREHDRGPRPARGIRGGHG